MLKVKGLGKEKQWIYRGFSLFVIVGGTSSLRKRKRLFYCLLLCCWRSLQEYDYKDSFHSLIFYSKQSYHQPNLQVVLKFHNPQGLQTSSLHAIFRSSTPTNLLCSVSASIPLNLEFMRNNPPQLPSKVTSTSLCFRSLMLWNKPNLQYPITQKTIRHMIF